MDSRQQFEEWHGNIYGYVAATTACDERWVGWQASRESLVIEIEPPHNDYENYTDSEVSGACKYYEQAKKHIHAAGIRTK